MEQPSFQELSFLFNMSSTQENKKKYQKWNTQDKKLFTLLFKKYGTDFDKYQSSFPSRTVKQIRYYFGNQVNKIKCCQKSCNIPKMNQISQQCEPENLQEIGCPKTDQIIIYSKDDNLMNQNEIMQESFLFDDFFQ
ncbi:SANT/Myb_domain [Hexamita inflata]|uniref:SANT/Myb domain n=1 Tax=Hexamita inflata TaxID=28002 RepID=A0AA86T9H3_9EUKA|nr:SANT/Myb domain [Hexamita inflata]